MTPTVKIHAIGSGTVVVLPWPSAVSVQGSTVAFTWEELERSEYQTVMGWVAERVEQYRSRSGTLSLLAYGGSPVCVDIDWLEPYSGLIRTRSYAGVMVATAETQERSRLGLNLILYMGQLLYRPGSVGATVISCGGVM